MIVFFGWSSLNLGYLCGTTHIANIKDKSIWLMSNFTITNSIQSVVARKVLNSYRVEPNAIIRSLGGVMWRFDDHTCYTHYRRQSFWIFGGGRGVCFLFIVAVNRTLSGGGNLKPTVSVNLINGGRQCNLPASVRRLVEATVLSIWFPVDSPSKHAYKHCQQTLSLVSWKRALALRSCTSILTFPWW